MKKLAILISIVIASVVFGSDARSCVKVGQTQLFCMENPGLATTVENRAQRATEAIEMVMADPDANIDSIVVRQVDSSFVVSLSRIRFFSVYPADTNGTGATVEEIAYRWQKRTVQGIMDERKRSVSTGNLAKLALGLLFPFLIIVAYILIHRLYTSVSKSVVKREGTMFRGMKFRGVEFMPARLQVGIMLKLLLFLKWVIIVIVFYAMILLFFNLFPPTQVYTEAILETSFNWLRSVGGVLIDLLQFVALAVVFYVVARILWGLADMIFRHYRTSPGTVKIPPEAIDPLHRTTKTAITLLYMLVLVAIIPGSNGIFSLALLLVGFVITGIAAMPFIVSGLSGFSILILHKVRSGDEIAVGSIRGTVVDVGVIWTKIAIEDGKEMLFLNKLLLEHPFAIGRCSEKDETDDTMKHGKAEEK